MPANPWSVERWKSKRVLTLKPSDRLVDAFELMREHHIRHVPIVERGRLVGIVSERDMRQALPFRRAAKDLPAEEYGQSLMKTALRDVMTKRVCTVTPATSLHEAAELLCLHKISALPIIENENLCGIITSEDLLWAFLQNTHEAEFR